MKKNAFTLIELLAVIIIMAILALLIVPRVTETVRDARKNSGEVSANALARAATDYYLEKKAQNRDFQTCTYNFDTNTNTCDGFEFTGTKPDSGKLDIISNGTVALAVQFGNYCYLKEYDTDNITTIDYNSITCGENAKVFTN